MENTQGVWVLYVIVLILNVLVVYKQTTAAKRPGIERTAGVIQPRYFQSALTLKWKSKMYLSNGSQKRFGEADLLLFSQETRGCRFIPG